MGCNALGLRTDGVCVKAEGNAGDGITLPVLGAAGMFGADRDGLARGDRIPGTVGEFACGED